MAGFLGPNGAGKTTSIRALLGLIRADGGQMSMLGLPMPSRRSIAMTATGTLVEKPSFLESMTGYENLMWFGSLFKPVTKARVEEILVRVGLAAAAKQSFGTYSTGMKQRLGVGYAVLHRPALLILDEPTNGMDPQGRYQMREILRDIHHTEKTTVFLSSHLIDEVQKLCDYVVIVGNGRTIREGFVKDILNTESEVYEFRLADNTDLDEALKSIDKLTGVERVTKGPQGVELLMQKGTSGMVLKTMVEKGFPVTAMIPKEASLEDTFISLTENREEPNR